MSAEPRRLDKLIESIADGIPIDWEKLDQTADTIERRRLGHLRIIAGVADVHRSVQASESSDATTAWRSLNTSGEDMPRWGHLVLIAKIGEGAFGEVYRARDPWLDHLRRAERVLYLAGDAAMALWIQRLNATAESLWFYRERRPRIETYREMVDRILGAVREPARVVVAFYGHPGVGAYPAHVAIRRARREGYPVRMLPGVSAEACLVADLAVDPLERGWQSHEAWRFIAGRPRFDARSPLILWQLGLIYQRGVDFSRRSDPKGLGDLVRTLRTSYPPTHRVVLSEASPLPMCDSRIEPMPLRDLPTATIRTSTTLYVPPLRRRSGTSRLPVSSQHIGRR